MLRINKLSAFLLLFATIFISSCKQTSQELTIKSLKIEGTEAVDPYLTRDNQQNPVLCWTEKSGADSLYRLKYAVFNPETESFDSTVTIHQSSGTNPSPESMNKVAFKNDGTVIAVFRKKFKNEKNPYAGAIYYSLSADNGKTWTPSQYLHSDTSHTYGRSFFDLTSLPNGEVAAIWLDGRFWKAETGSALFFSKTEKGKGFTTDKCITKSTCECCRTALITDEKGNIHIAYRSIASEKISETQIRDMSYIFSSDNGETFSKPANISDDKWEIKGCPHTGPSLAVSNLGVNALWYSGGASSGIYFASARTPQEGFSLRTLQTVSGRHPQMEALSQSQLALVWEEITPDTTKKQIQKRAHNGMQHGSASSPSDIFIKILNKNKEEKTLKISGKGKSFHHPVITTVKDRLVVAWAEDDKNKKSLNYSLLEL